KNIDVKALQHGFSERAIETRELLARITAKQQYLKRRRVKFLQDTQRSRGHGNIGILGKVPRNLKRGGSGFHHHFLAWRNQTRRDLSDGGFLRADGIVRERPFQKPKLSGCHRTAMGTNKKTLLLKLLQV